MVTPDDSDDKPLPAHADPTPLATEAQYRAALLAVRDEFGISARYLGMLRAHCRADDHTITATELAAAVDFQRHSTANLQYGKFARKLSDALGVEPSDSLKGTLAWWRVVAYGAAEKKPDEHFQWIMRPELVKALQGMKWA